VVFVATFSTPPVMLSWPRLPAPANDSSTSLSEFSVPPLMFT